MTDFRVEEGRGEGESGGGKTNLENYPDSCDNSFQ